jgi:hypothetical protein
MYSGITKTYDRKTVGHLRNLYTSKSVVAVQRAFRAKYANDPPTNKTIRAWYKQFTETWCLCKQKSSGRPLTAEAAVERVRVSFLHSPNKSTELQLRSYRCRKQQCGGFCVSVWCLTLSLLTSYIYHVPHR